MARIIGSIAASHTPTIGFAFDKNRRGDPVWAPIFENLAPLAEWLADKRLDVIVAIYNDHITSFFFNHYSAFAPGVGPEWPVAHCTAWLNGLIATRSSSIPRRASTRRDYLQKSDLIRWRDSLGLLHYDVIFFVLKSSARW